MTPMVLSSVVFLIILLLPAALLIRDWKFGDKRTVNYRRITKGLIIIWLLCGVFSTYFYVMQTIENTELQNKIKELVMGKDQLLGEISSLSKQIANYQSEIQVKDQRISELEEQSKILRSLGGKVECIFSGKWVHHPGNLVPMSWNKSQPYIQLLPTTGDKDSIIFLYLNSVKLRKLEDTDLKVELVVESRTESHEIGQKIDILGNYNSIIVNIPFLFYGDTTDHKVILKTVEATFVVNGNNKVNLTKQTNFEVPIPDKGNAGFQMDIGDLFSQIVP